MDIKEKRTQIATLSASARALYGEMETDEAKRTTDNTTKLQKMIDDGRKLRIEIEQAEAIEAMGQASLEPAGASKTAHLGGPGEGAEAQPYTGKSVGYRFVETTQFKALAEGQSRSARMEVKAILGETALSGGETIRADRQTEIVNLARQRPPSVIDLVNHSQTTLNSVDYVKMTGRTDTTAIVAEGVDKPEGDLAFAVVTVSVKTIAEWIKASKQILSDAPNLRNVIDNELEYMVRLKLENLVTADMIANAGQSRVHKVSGRAFKTDDTIADSVKRAMTDIALEFYEANGVIMHPTQSEDMELDKASDGHYTMVYDPVLQTVWRTKVVSTPAMTSGTILVGNFKLGYTVWDREEASVELGYIDKDFTMNLVTILGEMRAAYGTVRPKAIEKITGA